jgi:tRNA A-37 threonylcarbamoyl transferase component Bud32
MGEDMSVGTEPASWPQPRTGSEDATLAWLDALAGGICTPEAFLVAMGEQTQGKQDEGWEVLSLLDQYYRRGKIKGEVFHALKTRLEGAALNKDKDTPKAAPPLNKDKDTPKAGAALNKDTPKDAATPVRPHPSTAVTVPAGETRTSPAGEPRTAPAPASAKAVPRRTVREITVGDVLRNRYKVRGVVGHGGMATVFEATDEYRIDLPTAGRRLAVKVLHTAVTQREELLAELQREFQHLQLLSHPNIVRVHEFDRDGEVAFFTMELLNGALLSRVLQARNAVPLLRPHALAIIRDVGGALSHAHSRGVIHGDINPQNIFITNDGELRVLDFGASHKTLPDRWSAERSPVATPGYASCQLLEGQHPDARDDLFAFACVIYLLLSGQHPFPERTAIEARAQRIRPRRPAGLSGPQWRVLREGLRWDRERRPADVQQWLTRFGLSGAVRRLPASPALLNTPTAKTSRPLLTAAVVVAIALLAAGGYWVAINRDAVTRNFAEWRNQLSPPPDAAAQPVAAPAPAPISSQAPPVAATSSLPTAPGPAAAPRPAAAPGPTAAPDPGAAPGPTAAPLATAAPGPSAAPNSGAALAAGAASTASALAAPHPTQADHAAAVRAGTAGPIRIEMAADTVDVGSGETTAHVSVRRRGNIHGEASFKWWTESGTAKPGVDFVPVIPRDASIEDGRGSVSLDVPLSANPRTQSKSFYVVIDQSDSGGATLGARNLTMVTLQPPD